MTCEEALLLISGHIDQENTPEEEALLQSHLETCAQCRQVLQAFLEIDSGISSLEAEPPAELRENVMNQIRAEQRVKKKKTNYRWAGMAVAAALAVVIGIGSMGMPGVRQEETPALMTARAMPEPAAVSAEAVDSSAPEISYEALSDELGADLVVTRELFPEMEVCSCETLADGSLLYCLEKPDDAVALSRLYGAELIQPQHRVADCSYALLLSAN